MSAYANIRRCAFIIAACVCALDRERVFAMVDDGHPGYNHTMPNSYTCIERAVHACIGL